MEENTQIYSFPLFLNCGSKADWTALNKKANTLLGFPDDELAANYSNPIISASGDYYFIVQPETSSLVDLTLCVDYDKIVLPENKL